jgi:aspartyl-tRNA(Asn)/glutamyl-tRNA(Gln) amidotransferase subunit C
MLDRSEVLHIARLSRLNLEEAEVDRMASELSSILGHIERIGELDLQGVEPSAHAIAQKGALRADVPTASLSRADALAAAPDSDGTGFKVPAPGQ